MYNSTGTSRPISSKEILLVVLRLNTSLFLILYSTTGCPLLKMKTVSISSSPYLVKLQGKINANWKKISTYVFVIFYYIFQYSNIFVFKRFQWLIKIEMQITSNLWFHHANKIRVFFVNFALWARGQQLGSSLPLDSPIIELNFTESRVTKYCVFC